MNMSNMQMVNIKSLPVNKKIEMMHYFLYNLTLEVHVLIFEKNKEIESKFRTINRINNMILDYIIPLSQEKDTSYNDEIIAQNLIDMANQYDLENEISSSWAFGLSCVFKKEEWVDDNDIKSADII